MQPKYLATFWGYFKQTTVLTIGLLFIIISCHTGHSLYRNTINLTSKLLWGKNLQNQCYIHQMSPFQRSVQRYISHQTVCSNRLQLAWLTQKNGLVVVEGDTPSDVMCDLCAESLNRIFTPKLPFSDLTQWQGQYSSLIHKRFFSRAKSSPIVAQANVYFHQVHTYVSTMQCDQIG